jgi:hypothetical protein
MEGFRVYQKDRGWRRTVFTPFDPADVGRTSAKNLDSRVRGNDHVAEKEFGKVREAQASTGSAERKILDHSIPLSVRFLVKLRTGSESALSRVEGSKDSEKFSAAG